MKIFIATHKPAPFPNDENYIPIQNGKSVSPVDLNILGDNTGNHISERMPTFSECCALFWLVNNVDTEVVGLVHYRRYFSPVRDSVRVGDFDVAASTDFPEIGSADLVVSIPMDFSPLTVEQQYAISAIERDISIARGAVWKLFPKYIHSFDTIMHGNILTPYNMFVGKMEIIKSYCNWLFPILFLLEEWIPYQNYNSYQQRICAFWAERLFSVWLFHNEDRLSIVRRHVMALPY